MIKRFSPTAIGRWSTRRPVLAIAAWLTFVVAAVVALSLTGSKPLDNGAVGESARGYAMMDSHRLGLPPQEYVYLHSDSLKAGSPAFRTAIGAVDGAMRASDRERRERGGIARPALGARERDGHQAVRRDHRQHRGWVRGYGASGRERNRRGPDLRRRQRPAPRRRAVHSGHVARAVDLVRRARGGARAGGASGNGRDRGVRAARADQPAVPARRQREDRRAADRDGRRRRLRAVLRGALARGAPPWRLDPRGARAHVAHLGAFGTDRRNHGGDRDGRAVRGRLGHLQRDRGRHDRRGGVRGRRVGHRAAGAPSASRTSHRSRADPVPAAARDRGRVSLLGGRGRSRDAPAGVGRMPVGRVAGRAGGARLRAASGEAELAGALLRESV